MAVNLEELALKSIEQYAAFSVRLNSIEQALVELNRKGEIKEEKFIIACDKLSRLEEKLIAIIEDRVVIHKRIDDVKIDLDKVAAIVRDLAATVKDHNDDHCNNCQNNSEILQLRARVISLENPHPHTVETCNNLTTRWGYLYVKFITSKYGMAWMAATTANIILSFFVHYELIKKIWAMVTFE